MNNRKRACRNGVSCCSSFQAASPNQRTGLVRHKPRPMLFALLLVALSGCHSRILFEPGADCYYLNPDKQLSSVGRVAFIQLDNNSSYPQISSDMTQAIFLTLQKKQLFGLTVIDQDSPAWRSLQLDLDVPYDLEQLSAMRGTLKCDAVLTGTVTEYKPYPHMAIGLRMKLLDVSDGQLLWALEQVWDSSDKKTERSIRRYFESRMRSGSSPLSEQLAIVSSLEFIRFVAHEVAQTFRP
jgi:hypothetical protein